MATSAWGKPAQGAWAAAVEDEEKEHGPIQAPVVSAPVVPEDDFPSLGMAATVKETKKDKKKKAQPMSLGAFLKAPLGGAPSRSDDINLMSLPTAPRQRAEGEERPERPLGGAFGGYGGGREGGRPRFGDREDDDRGPRREREDMGPSRADMASDWGAERKFQPGDGHGGDRPRGGFGGGGGFRDRDGDRGDRGFGGGFRERDGSRERRGYEEGPSRADGVDNWGANKQFVPSTSGRGEERGRGGFEDRDRRGGGFGDRSGFGERRGFRDGSRDGGRDGSREPSRADMEDRWERRSDARPTAFDDRDPRGERGAGGPPAERPRLNIAPRTAPVEAGAPAPAAGASRASVFGAARPREEVLKEQGRDPTKEEDEREEAHEAEEREVLERSKLPPVDRPESQEEKELKQQITDLQVRMAAGEGDAQVDLGEGEGAEGAGARTVADEVQHLERQLRKLQLDLDAKVRAEAADREGGKGRPGPEAASSWRRAADAPPARDEGRGRDREGERGERRGFGGGGWGRDREERREGREGERGGNREREPYRGGDRGDRGGGGDSFRRRESSRDRPPARREGGW